MKRFHININVSDLDKSILFYNKLFNSEPTVKKDDYAKWMLDDPRINFSINNRIGTSGVNHLGLQAENGEEFSEIGKRLEAADAEIFDEGEATCCYAKSTKAWINDPDGISWETFLTHGEVTTYNGEELNSNTESKPQSACCAPVEKVEVKSSCC